MIKQLSVASAVITMAIGVTGCGGSPTAAPKSLPDDLKKIVDEAAVEARDYERKVNQENEAKLLADLKSKGMEVTEVDKTLFVDKVQSVYKEFEPIVGKDLVDMIRKQQ